ncbi:phosphohistidine phosphatase SixA [Pseudomonas sp. 21LCFQ02]|uniref:phosphohistidine phosphatase SixA n=1 Tax=unclassified Pseudomonas TaxID=196821 RepID=UPI0004F63E90|nr:MULTISPECIES: phosphohistidine phosphatase SixA [unclassified Pseudomonas]MCO8164286.1 phosphohistidine phosphatase SixA [Pseudomonas sp. 21LCFQ010]MCO8170381.1 phosphohistidine phosphatase SixA [Pseudomonas sp. 21LCFQ02]MCQ9425483.1 phosphohistidine phosphatase SixA [Pseudomonas sp. LJDD11]BAP45602.1 phosphohistidine phosphatase SixA [Pseudomonas sp. StFLB209]
MKLWVLRHGQAQHQARSDAERELTAEGRQQVRSSARHLEGRGLQRILVSPYVRAQQTADVLQGVLTADIPRVTVDWLTPDVRPDEALRQIAALELDEVLLVSHQPLVGSLIGLLVHGSVQDAEPMNTASLAQLDGEFVLAGALQLRNVHHV